MRRLLAILTLAAIPACSAAPTAPSSNSNPSVSTLTDISGAWKGTFASTNNASESITATLTQSGSTITGTWKGDTLAWNGQVNGTLGVGTFSGQVTFSGVAGNGTVCTGTATVAGPASGTTMTLTSSAGFVGGSCPAPLPVGVRIDLSK